MSRQIDLCIVCQRGTAGGSSRWAWLACENCRSVNAGLEKVWGLRPLALGRHSLMNGICVKGGAPPEVQERQLAELKQFAMGHTDLRNWEKSEYKKLASIFDPLADIPLREWQDVLSMAMKKSPVVASRKSPLVAS